MRTLEKYFAMGVAWCCVVFAGEVWAGADGARGAGGTLVKEPKYQSTPKYSLITLGKGGEVKVWMVEDGKRLFVDKNANGDLTDDGPPLAPTNVRSLGKDRWDFDYVLDVITATNGTRHTDFRLRRWNYNDPEDQYGLSLSVDGRMPMYAGWFGTFWSTKREEAPVMHFGGPFTPKLLRRKEFTVGEKDQRLSLCFINPGSDPGAVSRLSIDALPKSVVPRIEIEWPVANGKAPLRTSHRLTERCCYWEFYTTDFAVPKEAVAGNAKVSVDLLSFTTPLELTTNEITAAVVGNSKTENPQPKNSGNNPKGVGGFCVAFGELNRGYDHPSPLPLSPLRGEGEARGAVERSGVHGRSAQCRCSPGMR